MGTEEKLTELVEGHYIETQEGLFFAVKGLNHPNGLVIAYLRYVPDSGGDRIRDKRRYRRIYGIEETDSLLKEKYPFYLNLIESKHLKLQSVPIERIARVYSPKECLRTILEMPESKLEATTAKFVRALSFESGVSNDDFGVSGSALIGLAREDSDVDLIVYGVEAGRKVYDALKRLGGRGEWVRPYDSESVRKVVGDRWRDTDLDLEKFVPIEIRKVLHGLVDGRDFFVRLVRKPTEFEQESQSRPLWRVVIRVEVLNAEESIFTPCSYTVKGCKYVIPDQGPEVVRLVSYRGKFTEQAKMGDVVEARGTLEETAYPDRKIYRVMLGGRGDYLFPLEVVDR